MRRSAFAPAVLVLSVVFLAREARAQVIYEPVRYQYGGQTPFYYGGSDPNQLAFGDDLTHESGWGRTNGFAFHSGNVDTYREVSTEPERVLSDQLPYRNAAVWGYMAADARNTAYANVPRYFTKRDLLAAGVRVMDETGRVVVIVLAQAQPRPRIDPPAVSSTTAPTSASTIAPIVIIPTPTESPRRDGRLTRNCSVIAAK